MTTARARAESSKDDQVAYLLRKTIENGATPGEEVSAIQLAHMIVRQHGLDLDAFRAALAKVGDPPRYRITHDGFLVPAGPTQTAAEPGGASPDGASTAQATVEDSCPESPTGRHRMEKYMRGTVATGLLYCIHCGLRRDATGVAEKSSR